MPGKKTNLYVEVAADDVSRSTGLMHRKHLAEHHGMLFCFARDGHYSFWMQNTYVPLDIGFIDSTGKLLEVRELHPMSTRGIKSASSCRYALEVNRGWFSRNGVKPGMQLLKSTRKMAQVEGQPQEQSQAPVNIFWTFDKAVEVADKMGYDLLVTYQPGEDSQRRKHRRMQKDIDLQRASDPFGVLTPQYNPSQTVIGDYHLIIGLEDIPNLPDGIKPYKFETGPSGRNITAVVKKTGKPQTFTIDNVLDFNFLTPEGIKRPEEFDIDKLTEQMQNVYEPLFVDRPEVEDQPPEREMPQFENVQENIPDIPFWQGQLPAEEDKAPQEPEKQPWWKGYKDMWGLLRRNEQSYREFTRTAQEGGTDTTNMMVEYWEELKKKRGGGLTEGQAVLEYLKENEEKQKRVRDGDKPEKPSKKMKR